MKHTLAGFLLLLFGAVPLWAVLGQPVSSVQSDREQMRGTVRSVTGKGYSVQRIAAPYGGLVNEYVSPTGMVFGVSWKGAVMPNLAQLLGSYFTQLTQASKSHLRRRRGVIVRTNQVVIESGGHLHGFYGRAYVPGLLPANLSPSVVQ